jgi:hypothetical protein
VTPDVIAAKADGIVERVVALLTEEAKAPAPAQRSSGAVVSAPDDIDRFQEFVAAEGWSDGLPLLPPTPERVERMLGGWSSRRAEVIGVLAPRKAEATLEAIAVNAAMAGAGPEHFPVIVAALRAMTRPEFNLEAIQTTTHPCGPLIIVNGPIAGRLGVHGGGNAFGGGHRANVVIGRSVRLTLINVGGALPGTVDRATLGHPGKLAYCIAENEAASPWEPLHVERGFARDDSCVTVCGSDAPHNVNDHCSTTADALLLALAGTAATPGSNNVYLGGEPLIVLGPEHARTIADSGWTKRDLKRAFWQRAQLRVRDFSAENVARFAVIDPARFRGLPPEAPVAPCVSADDVMVIVAGGAGKHSAIVPTFGATRSVTMRIET